MFNLFSSVSKRSYEDAQDTIASLRRENRDFEQRLENVHEEYGIKIDKIKADHKIELQEKDFEIKYNKDKEIKAAKDELTKVQKELAEQKVENKMLRELVDYEADIIDVKNLVKTLIDKLPNVNISTLALSNRDEE